MKYFHGIAAGLAALSLTATMPAAHAATHAHDAAQKVRQLDIMLMVSALRCRTTPDGFQAEYNKFSANHLAELNAANRTLSKDLAQQYGAKGAKRALDKLSVSMANTYGQGHPWMNCHELKEATSELARNNQPGALLAAADQLLAEKRSGQTELAAGY